MSCTSATQVANVLDDGGHLKNYVNEFCDISPPLDKDDSGYVMMSMQMKRTSQQGKLSSKMMSLSLKSQVQTLKQQERLSQANMLAGV